MIAFRFEQARTLLFLSAKERNVFSAASFPRVRSFFIRSFLRGRPYRGNEFQADRKPRCADEISPREEEKRATRGVLLRPLRIRTFAPTSWNYCAGTLGTRTKRSVGFAFFHRLGNDRIAVLEALHSILFQFGTEAFESIIEAVLMEVDRTLCSGNLEFLSDLDVRGVRFYEVV